MKKLLLIFSIIFSIGMNAQNNSKTALLIIDIQDFYFPGGRAALINPEKASANAKLLLADFRKNKQLVVLVRHESEPGGNIQKDVTPLKSEKVISKKEVNAFKGTNLLEYLHKHNIDTLVICGMQTQMCVEAAVRAAHDYDFNCILIYDACATRNLKFGEHEIKAEDVQFATLNTLKTYAKVIDTKTFLTTKGKL